MKVDYSIFNYCTKCTLILLKQTIRCPECGQKVRTKPCYSSKATSAKRIYSTKVLAAKRI
jgi:hypothetical protein